MLTNPGVLKKRCTFLEWISEQEGAGLREEYKPLFSTWCKLEPTGALTYWFGKVQLDTDVTHRITVRRTERTKPEKLTSQIVVEVDGARFKILRSSDLEGAERFTVLDCSLEEPNGS